MFEEVLALNKCFESIDWLIENSTIRSVTNVTITVAGYGELEMVKKLVAYYEKRERTSAPKILFTEAAAAKNQVHVINHFLKEGVPLAPRVVEAAASTGEESLMEFMLSNGCDKDDGSVYVGAAANGHVNIMKWSVKHGFRWPSSKVLARVYKKAARNGHLSVLQWAELEIWKSHALYIDVLQHNDKIFTAAAKSNQQEVIKWLKNNGFLFDSDIIKHLARHGLKAVLWGMEEGFHLNDSVPLVAIKNQDMELLKWCFDNHLVAHDEEVLTELAAKHGNLSALEYMVIEKKFAIGDIGAAASGKGHIHILEWALKYKNPCYIFSMWAAICGGQLPTIIWLLDHDCPMPLDSLATATKYNQPHIFKWLHDNVYTI